MNCKNAIFPGVAVEAVTASATSGVGAGAGAGVGPGVKAKAAQKKSVTKSFPDPSKMSSTLSTLPAAGKQGTASEQGTHTEPVAANASSTVPQTGRLPSIFDG